MAITAVIYRLLMFYGDIIMIYEEYLKNLVYYVTFKTFLSVAEVWQDESTYSWLRFPV